MEIVKYSQDERRITEGISIQLWSLLKNNIPDSYSRKSKERNIGRIDSHEKISALLEESGRIFFTIQDTKDTVLAFLEMGVIEVDEGFYIQMTWIIVDNIARGKGFASQLHTSFVEEAQKIGRSLKKPWCLQLATSIENIEAQEIYKKWGYKEYKRGERDIFMFKDI